MRRQIALEDRTLGYTLRKSKIARRMRLAVYCDGSVVITTPFDMKESLVERIIRGRAGWLSSKIEFFRRYGGSVAVCGGQTDYLQRKNEAYQLAVRKVEQWNGIYGFPFDKINIKNQKTRWGSCSRKGNLNFNYKIAMLPERLVDYIVVHELCHLKVFNHSKDFWAEVIRAIPDYASIQEEIRTGGLCI